MTRYLPLLLAVLIGWFLGRTAERDLAGPAHAQAPTLKKPSEAEAKAMETVGLTTTLYLYQTYLNIGMLADCRTEEVYEEKHVRQLLASQLPALDTVAKQLQAIAKYAGSKAERADIEKMRKVISPLRRQGQELQTFWETGKQEHAKRYDAARRESWQNLSGLLGLDQAPKKKT